MTITDALKNISATAAYRNATKDQSWGGYITKTTAGLSTQDITDGKYKVIFVQKDGDQYVFTYGGTASGAYTYTGYIAHGASGAKGTGDPVAATTMTFDNIIMKSLVSDGWIYGSMADFEQARNGAGEW